MEHAQWLAKGSNLEFSADASSTLTNSQALTIQKGQRKLPQTSLTLCNNKKKKIVKSTLFTLTKDFSPLPSGTAGAQGAAAPLRSACRVYYNGFACVSIIESPIIERLGSGYLSRSIQTLL